MKYFTIDELCKSVTASNKHIDNTPNEEQRENLIALIVEVLDPLREAFGKPIIVNSGFRCEKLNKLVGGAKTSQHTTGEAVDIQSVGDKYNKELFALALKTCKYDQLIFEYDKGGRVPDWIHISFKKNGGNRKQVLEAVRSKNKTVYIAYK